MWEIRRKQISASLPLLCQPPRGAETKRKRTGSKGEPGFLIISTPQRLEEILRGIASWIGRALLDRSKNFHQDHPGYPEQSMHRRTPARMPRRTVRRPDADDARHPS